MEMKDPNTDIKVQNMTYFDHFWGGGSAGVDFSVADALHLESRVADGRNKMSLCCWENLIIDK